MNKLLKNPGIVISVFIVGMVAINILFSHSVLASMFSQLPDNYHVYEDTTTDRILYWNGSRNNWDIISAPNIPRVYFNGGGCDTADSDLRFDGSKIYWNCSSLVVRASTMSWWFDEANLAYRIADFDSRETATVSGGRITQAGSLSDVTITNGGKDARSDSYGCPGGNPNTTDDCSILVLFSYRYTGEGFRLVVNDRTYLPSQHEYYYDAPSLKDFRTLTFHPNGDTINPATVTDVTSGRALWYHKVGENAKREFEKGVTAQNWPTPTRSGYSFDGWYTAASGGDLAPASRVMNTNETYYAHWTEDITSSGFTPLVTPADFEKGSSSVNVTHSIIVDQAAACTVANQVITKTWSFGGAIGPTGSKTLTVNCGAVGVVNSKSGDSTTVTIDNTHNNGDIDTMNAASPGTTYNRFTKIDSDQKDGNILVFEVPYTRFYGHDIYATSATSGGIYFNTKNTVENSSSAVEYAAIAAGSTNPQILTAFARSATAIPNAFNSLGARWNGGPPSPASVPAQYLFATSTAYTGGALPGTTGYYTSSGATISGGSISNTSNKVTINNTGDLYITGNISAEPLPASINTGAAFDGAAIPVVLLITNGNIYIRNNVTEIDAILISTNGTVFTCATGTTPTEVARNQWSRSSALGGCANKLLIKGALGAREIRFARSVGTRLMAAAGESYSQTQGNTTAAESIYFPPYLYFASPYLNNPGNSTYQSLFNAPPLF